MSRAWECAFNEPLVFTQKKNTCDSTPKKLRKRRICFKLLFSLNITIIGKTFPKLSTVYFPKSNSLYKIFNKNMVKVSYSCMNYMSSIIWLHKKRPLRPRTTEYGCNFQTTVNCPLQNQYLMPSIIYPTGVESNTTKGTKIYLGLAKTSFKEQFRKHNEDLNYEQYRKSTELSKCMWS